VQVIIGMLQNKDALGFLTPFAHKIETLIAVPIPGHEHHAPSELCEVARSKLQITDAQASGDIITALGQLAGQQAPANVLICGSLYLAGEVLRLNDQVPD
jgi:dihydrofolate synthase/folylpolyglutamate synthase